MNKNRIRCLVGMAIIGSIITIVYLILTGNSYQVFNELIYEQCSFNITNKDIERRLLFGLIFAGLAVYLVYYLFTAIKGCSSEAAPPTEKKRRTRTIVLNVLTSAAIVLLINDTQEYTLLGGLILCMLIYWAKLRRYEPLVIYLYFMSCYALCGAYRIAVLLGLSVNLITPVIMAIALLLTIAPLLTKSIGTVIRRLILIEALFIPFSLLSLFVERYRQDGDVIYIRFPIQTKLMVFAIVAVLIAEAGLKLKKHWSADAGISKLISVGTCITLTAYNSFQPDGAVIGGDLHHPYENIIGFTQIFQLGQIPFKEYIPISGMYSVVHGALFQLFGNGLAANDVLVESIFQLFLAIAIVLLLRLHVENKHIFLIGLFFIIGDYDRVFFILPIMLLLSAPKLIEKKNAWLVAWFLTSLFHGLYYPLYGAAVCAGFAPLGIWQIVTFIRSGELKKAVKTVRFWLGWAFCAVLLAGSSWLLLGTYRHMSAMADQSLLNDGMCRFGQTLPEWFLYCLHDLPFLRITIYYIVSWMIPTGVVWIGGAVALRILGISVRDKKIKTGDLMGGLCAASLVIAPIISYTFTFTRLETKSTFSRSAGIMYAVCVVMMVLVLRSSSDSRLRKIVIFVTAFIPILNSDSSFMSLDDMLYESHRMDSGYTLIENYPTDKMGKAFCTLSAKSYLDSGKEAYDDLDTGRLYLGEPQMFGFFYLYGVRGVGPMEISLTVKSAKATNEAIDYALSNHAVIGITDPSYNYYLHYWLLNSGEYIWNEDEKLFMPNDEGLPVDEVRELNHAYNEIYNNYTLSNHPASFAASMDTLSELFTPVDVSYTITGDKECRHIVFDEPVNGSDADFMYIELEGLDNKVTYGQNGGTGFKPVDDPGLAKFLIKKRYNYEQNIQLCWDSVGYDEPCSYYAAVNEGKLLISLGSGKNWLLYDHNGIDISGVTIKDLDTDHILDGGYVNIEDTDAPGIAKIQFLKLRECR